MVRRTFVLSGGGALGALQVGALRALLEKKVQPDMVVGCSAGALNASFLARGVNAEQVERAADVWRAVTTQIVYPGGRLGSLWRVVSGQDSLHDNRRFYSFLQEVGCTPALTFGASTVAPLYVTATNLRTGMLHVFGDNPNDRILDALMASTALTPMHPPWEINGERYVDGGTVTPLPLRVALDRGATEIWALHTEGVPESTAPKPVRGVTAIIGRALDTMLNLQVQHDLHLAEDARRVNLHHIHLITPRPMSGADFSHADELIDAGYAQAVEYLAHQAAAPVPIVAPVTQWWHSVMPRLNAP
jgi:NTE family protein